MTAAVKKAAAKRSASLPKAADGLIQMSGPKATGKSKVAIFQFGSASLKVPARHEDWARNIDLGQQAMKKIKRRLVQPGVKLRASKSTPLFRADPANPRQLIRDLGGREERGVFENGVFKVLG